MVSQRGVIAEIYLYGLAAVAICSGAFYAYYTIDHRGYQRGQAEVREQWNAANTKAQAAADAQSRERARLAADQSAALATADVRARNADARWRQARATAARAATPLAVADCPTAGGALPTAASGPVTLRLATAITFTADFVREFDSAWGGATGESLFDYQPGIVEKALAASPVDAAAVLAVHAENASRCSASRRQLNALIDLLEKLRSVPR